MPVIKNVFIVEEDSQGWIINHLMRDIAARLLVLGIPVRIGKAAEYRDEQVVFNSRFMTPFHAPSAQVNSLFITHVDDKIKELELRAQLATFNSFVCMSPEDADFVAGLKGDRNGVAGIELPARDQRMRPVRLAFFSARYDDGRKNEEWLVEYFRAAPPAKRDSFVLCFLGSGWETFGARLAELQVNFEIYHYSRLLPGEYALYKEVLSSTDALIYPGFDGGAMSVYDAVAAGIDVIASDTSYHRGLGDSVALFKDRAQFFAKLDEVHARHAARVSVLRERSIESYTARLLAHWSALASGTSVPSNGPPGSDAEQARAGQTLVDFRRNYKPLSITRIRSAMIRWFQSRFIRS